MKIRNMAQTSFLYIRVIPLEYSRLHSVCMFYNALYLAGDRRGILRLYMNADCDTVFVILYKIFSSVMWTACCAVLHRTITKSSHKDVSDRRSCDHTACLLRDIVCCQWAIITKVTIDIHGWFQT